MLAFAVGILLGACLGGGAVVFLMCAGTMMLEPPSKYWHRGVKL
jgi:hypothetical protein